uniref:Uncharacterized protein n=1 Tax=Anopheles maculatus TaxID=74869 RepID=A0A182SL51_9DIPT
MERPPVISPDLIREVEARMNRDYLPPSLLSSASACSSPSSGTGPNSGPTAAPVSKHGPLEPVGPSILSASIQAPPTFSQHAPAAHHSNLAGVLGPCPAVPTPPPAHQQLQQQQQSVVQSQICNRRYATRTCKLPTVQEIGK